MATDQCLRLGLVVEQVLGFCSDTMSKGLLIYIIYFFTETSMVIYQYKEKDLEAKLGYT